MNMGRLMSPLLIGALVAGAWMLPAAPSYAACSDCDWLWLRCMRNAGHDPEREQQCEESRQLCVETFCQNPLRADVVLLPAARPQRLISEQSVSPPSAPRKPRQAQ